MRSGDRSAGLPDEPPVQGPAVFISYTAADESWAQWVAWQLQGEGYRPRLQAWHSVPGQDFVGWINAELRAAIYVVVILSPAYLMSDWAEAELNAALTGAIGGSRALLVPVRVAPCESPELLRSIVRINLVDCSEAEARAALTSGMRAAANAQTVPTVPPPYPGPPGRAEPPPYPGPDRMQLTARLLDLVEQACRLRCRDAMIRRPTTEKEWPALQA